MGMYDNVDNVPVVCPRCGDNEPKSVQIKCGPQNLSRYIFGKDEIDIDWDYSYYDSIVDKGKGVIGGIASCAHCRKEAEEKMQEIIKDARNKGEVECPDGSKFLFECLINGEDALSIILKRLDDAYDGNRSIDLFGVTMQIEKNIPIFAAVKIGPKDEK